jgi:UDP-N-acetylmuramate--alanine ligase
LYCVFQPHQYQRTYKLFEQFIGAFGAADQTIILPIFSVPGREKDNIKKKVNSEKLVKEIGIRNLELGIKKEKVFYADSFIAAKNYLKKNLKEGDVCVIMGAGDVYKLTEMLI